MVDKPSGWTSHDVVARCRKIFGQRRIGHAGTLDPGATGVLVVGLGRVTRLLRFLAALPKSYVGEAVLGVETTTLDDAGEEVARHDMAGVTLADVQQAATRFVGQIEQVPPMVSAVKMHGRRLYELARAGEEVERAARPVVVHRFDVGPTADPGVFRIEVDCSSGTYVRTLVADLGTALGGGAHLRRLRRTAVGSFDLGQACPLDSLDPDRVMPPASALRDYAGVTVGPDTEASVAHGAVLDCSVLPVQGDGPWPVLAEDGRLLAVYESRPDGRLKPAVVLVPAEGRQ